MRKLFIAFIAVMFLFSNFAWGMQTTNEILDECEIIRIVVEFVTPPAIVFQFIYERDNPMSSAPPIDYFIGQALEGHVLFWQQLEYEFSLLEFEKIESFGRTYRVSNTEHLRVPCCFVERIVELPEVMEVTPYIVAELPGRPSPCSNCGEFGCNGECKGIIVPEFCKVCGEYDCINDCADTNDNYHQGNNNRPSNGLFIPGEPIIVNPPLITNDDADTNDDNNDNVGDVDTDNSEISVYIDSVAIVFDVAPIIVENRTLVPFRAIFEALGMTVEWDNDARSAIGTNDDVVIEIPIDSTTSTVNGESVELDVAAMLYNERTFVPLRFVAENSGANVEWCNDTRTVLISMP